jgi:hypothetical protein
MWLLRSTNSICVVDFKVAEEGGLRFDLGAVADGYDLHVC